MMETGTIIEKRIGWIKGRDDSYATCFVRPLVVLSIRGICSIICFASCFLFLVGCGPLINVGSIEFMYEVDLSREGEDNHHSQVFPSQLQPGHCYVSLINTLSFHHILWGSLGICYVNNLVAR